MTLAQGGGGGGALSGAAQAPCCFAPIANDTTMPPVPVPSWSAHRGTSLCLCKQALNGVAWPQNLEFLSLGNKFNQVGAGIGLHDSLTGHKPVVRFGRLDIALY